MAEQAKATESCPACGKEILPGVACCPFTQTVDESIPVLAAVNVVTTGQRVPINSRWLRIGRDETNQIVIQEDFFASRYHAWITYEQDGFWVEDLGSTNGTLLNGHALERRELLKTGDKIKIGETEMIFELLDSAE